MQALKNLGDIAQYKRLGRVFFSFIAITHYTNYILHQLHIHTPTLNSWNEKQFCLLFNYPG
jgi:uncharacterized short protein YbdD (DUF466 family)